MKKLKIFLLLSILLCFGFTLSYEVHAQGGGPKEFEVGDVLPATTQLRISWPGVQNNQFYFDVRSDNWSFKIVTNDGSHYMIDGIPILDSKTRVWVSPYNSTDHAYIDINTSTWSESKRTIIVYDTGPVEDVHLYWEDLAPAPSGYSITFEENGGTSVTDLSGQTALPNPLPTPTKENHTFLGWYYDSDFTNEAFAGDPLTGDVTLYAKWGLTSGPKIFEVGDVLPQGIIRVSWDETTWYKMPEVFGEPDSGHQIKSSNNSFNFIEKIGVNYYVGGIPVLYIPEPGNLEFYPPYTVYGEGHAFVDINTTGWDLAKRTISTVIWSDWELVSSRLYWEDITPDGYTQGYQAAKEYYGWEDGGYWYTAEEAWDMGNEYAREIYGYYDPITEQWLSVSEYLDLYGTDKPGQSDFYNNFDKYFIPAMIIVFGGAIVLTILKVFKGRE